MKIPPCNARDTGAIPGRGTEIPYAAGQLSQSAETRVRAPQGISHVPRHDSMWPNKYFFKGIASLPLKRKFSIPMNHPWDMQCYSSYSAFSTNSVEGWMYVSSVLRHLVGVPFPSQIHNVHPVTQSGKGDATTLHKGCWNVTIRLQTFTLFQPNLTFLTVVSNRIRLPVLLF